MEHQWTMALIGGSIVGIGGCWFLLMNGRVLGSSGILGGLVDGSGHQNRAERIAFIAGLAGVPFLITLIYGAPLTNATGNFAVLIAGGLLTGLGTRLANGCTSGHAISGISRFSPRAIVATASYTTAAAFTVVLFRHVLEII